MKLTAKICILATAITLAAGAAQATSIDPGIIIRDPVGCPNHNCIPITSLSFGFAVPSRGFGVLHFLNSTGVTWTSLILTEPGVPAVNVTCSSDVFSCGVVAFGQNGAKIVLTAINDLTGIPAGNSFEIILGCKNGKCNKWPERMEFEAVANSSVPEPGTVALLLTGLGAMFTRRKLASAA